MQKKMERQDKDVTNSLLWDTYNTVNTYRMNGVDIHHARALLAMYWKHGDKVIPMYNRPA